MSDSSDSQFNLNRSIPLLILGDGGDQHSGLGRIGHDLAWLLSSMPEFKVGYLGRLAVGRAKYPWAQYSFGVDGGWGEGYIQDAWDDLSQGERGIIFTVWDASRLLWFANPVGLPKRLQVFLSSGQFERWGYFMQDSDGIRPGQLPLEVAEVFARYDRVLLASKWAYLISKNTLGNHPDMDWIPHGINRNTFKPEDRLYARSGWGVGEKDIVIGCVMSNTERKHWPTVMEAVGRIQGSNAARLWIHTDRLVHYWNLNALAVEYGLVGDSILYEGRDFSDRELAMRYSACDATVVISGGEGFCYPVAESLSCGTPVVSGTYGAQAELGVFGVHPIGTKIETLHNVRRAYYDGERVSEMLVRAIESRIEKEEYVQSVEHLHWPKLKSVWGKWIREGIAQ